MSSKQQAEVGRYVLLNEVLQPYNLWCWMVEHKYRKMLHIKVLDVRGVDEVYSQVIEDDLSLPYLELAQKIIDQYVNTGVSELVITDTKLKQEL